jgi:peptidyl-prolyl cis-trans isomerase D
MNTSLTPDQVKELGILDSTMQAIIDRHLLDLEAARLGLAINDAAVRQAILANPAFRGPTGIFDRNTYLQLLDANQLTDQQYEAMLRSGLVRNRITDSMTAGAGVPPELVDALWQSRGQRRIATVLVLPPRAVGDIGAPDAATLAKYYKAHQNDFMLPARRGFTVALIDPSSDLAAIKIPEDQIEAAYKKRSGDFVVPEKRVLRQILVPDETKAKAVTAALAAGQDFAQVAQKLAGEKPGDVELGALSQKELPGALGKAVFDLKPGGVTQPIHDPFGWHIVKLVKIIPPTTAPLAEVKAKLLDGLRRDQAADQAAKTANSIDDAMANGSAFKDIVARFKLKTVVVASVDATGHDAAGKAVTLPAPSDKILATAFATAPGRPSDLKDLPDQGYYMIEFNGTTPAAPQPLAQIHDKVTAAWQESARAARLEALARDMASAVDKGQKLDDIAALHGLKTFTTAPLSRDATDSGIPPFLTAKLFGAKLGKAVSGPAKGDNDADGAMVAAVTQILPPDPAREKQQKAAIEAEVRQSSQADLLSQFEQALRQRFPVSVNQDALNRLL